MVDSEVVKTVDLHKTSMTTIVKMEKMESLEVNVDLLVELHCIVRASVT